VWKTSTVLFPALFLISTADAQNIRYSTPPVPGPVVYIVPLSPISQPTVNVTVRPNACDPMIPFTPSGVTAPANGGSYQSQNLNKVHLMNITYLARARHLHSLNPTSYELFASTANSMSIKRGALLRRRVFELPPHPTANQMMTALNSVASMTNIEVAAYWSAQ